MKLNTIKCLVFVALLSSMYMTECRSKLKMRRRLSAAAYASTKAAIDLDVDVITKEHGNKRDPTFRKVVFFIIGALETVGITGLGELGGIIEEALDGKSTSIKLSHDQSKEYSCPWDVFQFADEYQENQKNALTDTAGALRIATDKIIPDENSKENHVEMVHFIISLFRDKKMTQNLFDKEMKKYNKKKADELKKKKGRITLVINKGIDYSSSTFIEMSSATATTRNTNKVRRPGDVKKIAENYLKDCNARKVEFDNLLVTSDKRDLSSEKVSYIVDEKQKHKFHELTDKFGYLVTPHDIALYTEGIWENESTIVGFRNKEREQLLINEFYQVLYEKQKERVVKKFKKVREDYFNCEDQKDRVIELMEGENFGILQKLKGVLHKGYYGIYFLAKCYTDAENVSESIAQFVASKTIDTVFNMLMDFLSFGLIPIIKSFIIFLFILKKLYDYYQLKNGKSQEDSEKRFRIVGNIVGYLIRIPLEFFPAIPMDGLFENVFKS